MRFPLSEFRLCIVCLCAGAEMAPTAATLSSPAEDGSGIAPAAPKPYAYISTKILMNSITTGFYAGCKSGVQPALTISPWIGLAPALGCVFQRVCRQVQSAFFFFFFFFLVGSIDFRFTRNMTSSSMNPFHCGITDDGLRGC